MKNNRTLFAGLLLLFVGTYTQKIRSEWEAGSKSQSDLVSEKQGKLPEILTNLQEKTSNLTQEIKTASTSSQSLDKLVTEAGQNYYTTDMNKQDIRLQKNATLYQENRTALNDLMKTIVEKAIEIKNPSLVTTFVNEVTRVRSYNERYEASVQGDERQVREQLAQDMTTMLKDAFSAQDGSNFKMDQLPLSEKIELFNAIAPDYGEKTASTPRETKLIEAREVAVRETRSSFFQEVAKEAITNKQIDALGKIESQDKIEFKSIFKAEFLDQFNKAVQQYPSDKAKESVQNLLDSFTTMQQKGQEPAGLINDLIETVKKAGTEGKSDLTLNDATELLKNIQEVSGLTPEEFNRRIGSKFLQDVKVKQLDTATQQNYTEIINKIKEAVASHTAWSFGDAIAQKFKNVRDAFKNLFSSEQKELNKNINDIAADITTLSHDRGFMLQASVQGKQVGDLKEEQFTQTEQKIQKFVDKYVQGPEINYEALGSLLRGIQDASYVEPSTKKEISQRLLDAFSKDIVQKLPDNPGAYADFSYNVIKEFKRGGSLSAADKAFATQIQNSLIEQKLTAPVEKENAKKSPSTENSFLGAVEAAGDAGDPTQSDANNALSNEKKDLSATSAEFSAADQQKAAGSHSETTAPNENRGSDTLQSGEGNSQPNNSSVDPTSTGTPDGELTQGSEEPREGADKNDTESDAEQQAEEEARERAKADKLGEGQGEGTEAGAEGGAVEASGPA